MITPFRLLFAAPLRIFSDDHMVAHSAGGVRTWGHLCGRISAWEQALAPLAGDLVALHLDDSYEFFAALAGLWRLGKRALVPSNNLPATYAQLATFTPHFAGDFPLAGVITPTSTTATPFASIPLPPADNAALVLFTSGSTGAPQPVSKSFAQLEAELDALESRWGTQLAGASIASSVSHHHRYGLLFRLLWPLCAGRPYVVAERNYWEELAEDVRRYQPLALVSSPAHLSRIPALEWPEQAQIAAIFCSGGPLALEAALGAKAQLGQPVTEVYGSTETGGIGWRSQDKSSVWHCLPGVEVALASDSLLQVRSPHLADDNWYITSDRASLEADGSFTICGRADRIAKVSGKRISLSEIERLLERQPGVAQARVLLLPERGERLGAVVVLDNAGNKPVSYTHLTLPTTERV